jgi:Zn-dependent protease
MLAAFIIWTTNKGHISEFQAILYFQLLFVNLVWPILNLLPIWPLDGGRISRETFQWVAPQNGTSISLIISAILAGFFAIHSLAAANGHPLIPFLPGGIYMGLFFAMFAASNIQEWLVIRHQSRRPWENESESW